MDRVLSGITLALIGLFLGFITYKKYSFFWNFFNTRLLRKYLGDNFTSATLYVVSIVFIVFGFLLSLNIIQ